MKQSTIVMLFGMVYAIIAISSIENSLALSLLYAFFAAVSASISVLLCDTEQNHGGIIWNTK